MLETCHVPISLLVFVMAEEEIIIRMVKLLLARDVVIHLLPLSTRDKVEAAFYNSYGKLALNCA